jgi:organic radical activating enzyme
MAQGIREISMKKYGETHDHNYESLNVPSNSWCPMPWTSIATNPSGGYKPCCEVSKAFMGTVKEYKTSEYLNKIKSQFLSGEFPEVCNKCKAKEDIGSTSKRIRELKKFKYYFDDVDMLVLDNMSEYLQLDLRLSNKCNLGCVTCNPRNSSFIFDETISNMESHTNTYTFHIENLKNKNLVNPYEDSEVTDILNSIQPGAMIYFTGGEPTVVKSVRTVIETLLENGQNENVRLEFNSNFQSHNPKFIDTIKHFEGRMLASIDAIGRPGEYIRYPSKWKDVEYNLLNFKEQCPDMDLVITPTISNLNILQLNKIEDWCKQNDIRASYTNILTGPDEFNISFLPTQAKEAIAKVLENGPISNEEINPIINFMLNQEEDIRKLRKCKESLTKIDSVRGTNYRDYLHNLSEILWVYLK